MASFLIATAAFTLLLFLRFPSPTVLAIVIDVDGNMVPNGGGKYYMQPYPKLVGAGPIGWLSEKNTCPLYVTRTPFTEATPEPSTITLSSPFKSLFIPEGPIFIKFNDENTPCETKPLWWFIKPKIGIDVDFLELGAGTDNQPSFSLKIENAHIEGKHVFQLKYCVFMRCRFVVERPDNSGVLGVDYGVFPNVVKPFQFELEKAESYLKMKI